MEPDSTSIACTEPQPKLLFALDPAGVAEAGRKMSAWAAGMVQQMEFALSEQELALATAKENGWQSGTLFRAVEMTRRRIAFYSKIKIALDAGYLVIPNLPLDNFAIRTNRKGPVSREGDR